MPIAKAAVSFLRYCLDERHLTNHTLDAYRQDLNEFQRHVTPQRRISEIGPDEIVAYHGYLLGQRGLSPATVKRRFACLRRLFTWLVKRQMLSCSPFATIEIQTRLPRRLPRSLSAAELRSLIRGRTRLGGKCALAAGLLIVTGMRVGELTALQVGDIDTASGVIKIFGKGSRERIVFVTDPVLRMELCDYIGPAANVFNERKLLVDRCDRPVRTAQIRQWIRRLGNVAGIKRRLTPHMLRHTAATMLVESGTDIRLVQRLLGHQSILTTQQYTHVSDQALQSALARADILRRFGKAA